MGGSFGIHKFEMIGLKTRNLKCFREDQGYEEIKPFNVIIGRNNAGKSTLLDLVQFATDTRSRANVSGYRGQRPLIYSEHTLTKGFIGNHCTENMAFGRQSFRDSAHQLMQDWRVPFDIVGQDKDRFIREASERISSKFPHMSSSIHQQVTSFYEQLSRTVSNPFAEHIYRRIVADRDIKVESVGQPSDGLQDLQPDGRFATTLITRYLSQKLLNRYIVETKIVQELNHIFNPDSHFEKDRRGAVGEWRVGTLAGRGQEGARPLVTHRERC